MRGYPETLACRDKTKNSSKNNELIYVAPSPMHEMQSNEEYGVMSSYG
jgi:hypothetical protein